MSECSYSARPDSLPTQFELAQLAATLAHQLPPSWTRTEQSVLNAASSRVNLALAIWMRAGEELATFQRFQRLEDQENERLSDLLGPLKIGKALLPSVDHQALKRGKVGFKSFVKQVAGGARLTERMPWWRAFMRARQSAWEYSKRYDAKYRVPLSPGSTAGTYLNNQPCPELRGQPGWPVPDDLGEIEVGDTDTIEWIERQQNEGFMGHSGVQWAIEFREWRLGMSTPNEPLKEFADLEECRKNALAELENA